MRKLNILLLLVCALASWTSAGRLGLEQRLRWLSNARSGMDSGAGHYGTWGSAMMGSTTPVDREHFILDILLQVQKPLVHAEMLEWGQVFNGDVSMYSKPNNPYLRWFVQHAGSHSVIGHATTFDAWNWEHAQQVVGYYNFLVMAPDWTTFVQNVCYGRVHLNPVVFVTGLYMAVRDRHDTADIALPPMNEVLPEMFYENKVVQMAQQVDWSHLIGRTGTKRPQLVDVVGVHRWTPVHWWSPFQHWSLGMRSASVMPMAVVGGGEVRGQGWWDEKEKVVVPVGHVSEGHYAAQITDDVGLNVFWHHVLTERLMQKVMVHKSAMHDDYTMPSGWYAGVEGDHDWSGSQKMPSSKVSSWASGDWMHRSGGSEYDAPKPMRYGASHSEGHIDALPTTSIHSDRLVHVNRRWRQPHQWWGMTSGDSWKSGGDWKYANDWKHGEDWHSGKSWPGSQTSWMGGEKSWMVHDKSSTGVGKDWVDGEVSWSGGEKSWPGGEVTWPGGKATWPGGKASWPGGESSWSGGETSWPGGKATWPGGRTSWPGGEVKWMGGEKSWSGSDKDMHRGQKWYGGGHDSGMGGSSVVDDDEWHLETQPSMRTRRNMDSVVPSTTGTYMVRDARSGEIFLHNLQQMVARMNFDKIAVQSYAGQSWWWWQQQSPDIVAAIKEVVQRVITEFKSVIDRVVEQRHVTSSDDFVMRMIADMLIGRDEEHGHAWEQMHEDVWRAVYKYVPGAMEHSTIANLHEPVEQYFMEELVHLIEYYKHHMPPHTVSHWQMDSVRVYDVNVDHFVTYTEWHDSDLINVIDQQLLTTDGNNMEYVEQPVVARQRRLNHQPFSMTYELGAERSQRVVVRTLMGPKIDTAGRPVSFADNSHNFIVIDAFAHNLQSGRNMIQRHSHDISWTTRDVSSIRQMYAHVFGSSAVWPTTDDSMVGCNCRYPHRLLIPRGTVQGLPVQIVVVVTPAVEKVESYHVDMKFMCGMGIPSIQWDHLPLGFPMDRHFESMQQMHLPNVMIKDTVIHHVEKPIY